MRGEDFATAEALVAAVGSPPHARGRRSPGSSTEGRRRITPACAGKTTWLPGCYQQIGDHPRMRGEDHPGRHPSGIHEGSPPHARGRPVSGAGDYAEERITPACAGKTIVSLPVAPQQKDHPRMRGEDPIVPLQSLAPYGSPPHARGRLQHLRSGLLLHRITPACAGKTAMDNAFADGGEDHPRMRGEDSREKNTQTYIMGSPPHARGRLSGMAASLRSWRITPACAGKTIGRPFTKPTYMDHPRMRGEDTARTPANTPANGSPPHARGRLIHVRIPIGHDRITPACAGKT